MGSSYRKKASRKRDGPRPEKKKEETRSAPVAPLVFLSLVLVLAGSALGVYLSQRSSGGDDEPVMDTPTSGSAPPVSDIPAYLRYDIENIDGGTFRLEQFKGKIILLDMYATWCGPCAYQMDELRELKTYYSPSDLVIISINTDPQETAAMSREFRDKHYADWPFGMASPQIRETFPASSIPTLYFLDREGKIVDDHVGAGSALDLRIRIDRMV
ncbi:MAG: TlpA disulfide reductase family protein [Candidatus Thermoplasmatota archaeon]|nr:TlpA disulfide reductase family protein [Candidatus Thermoplasmatota archaeon]